MIIKNYFELSDSLKEEAKNEVLKCNEYTFYNENPNYLNYVLIDDDKVVGGIDFMYAADSSDLLFIYIKNDYRGKGLSKTLLNYGLDKLKENMVNKIYLEVSKDNNVAYNLYKSIGFNETGVRKGYYDGVDAIIMELNIEV